MAINPYTLNHLYQNGILDYVPTDLMMGTPIGGALTPMNNPYMNMAQQGALYQNYGAENDSFHSSYTPAYTPTYYKRVETPANTYTGINYNNYNNGMIQSGLQQARIGRFNTFNGYRVGGYPDSIENVGNIGIQLPNENKIDAYNDFSNLQNNLNNGINKVSSAVSNTPKLILGLIAGTIGLVGIAALFKKGAKPSKTNVNHSNLLTKLNPMNWFKKNK